MFIVLIRYASFGPGDLRDHADVVIAAFHRLPVAHVLDEQAAGLIIGVARYVFQRVRHLGQLVHTTASILI